MKNVLYDYPNGEIITETKNVHLSNVENKIMKVLVMHKNRYVDSKKIAEITYGKENEFLSLSLIPTNISRIRKKLGKEIEIKNQNGYGYKLNGNIKAVKKKIKHRINDVKLIELLKKHIEKADRMQDASNVEVEIGKYAGIREEAETILKYIGGTDDKRKFN